MNDKYTYTDEQWGEQLDRLRTELPRILGMRLIEDREPDPDGDGMHRLFFETDTGFYTCIAMSRPMIMLFGGSKEGRDNPR